LSIHTNGRPEVTEKNTSIVGEFDDIVDQLRGMLDRLQGRVVTLTNDLQMAADISTRVASILELKKLLPQLAEEIKEGFNLHHVNIYMMDEAGEKLVLQAASGRVGSELLRKGYMVDITDEGNIVAHAARDQRAIVSNDTEHDTRYHFSGSVEGTRAKLVVPMITQGEVVGVLAVQADTVDRFDDTDVRVKTTLAEQLAVAVKSAQAFAEVQEARSELLLSNQAIQASASGVSIADATMPDMPLIFVNPAFTQITGYTEEEAVGSNCRFLQGDDRDQESVDAVRHAIQNQEAVTVVLRNYRKDGTMFWNELSVAPLFDSGQLTHYVGIQTDITDRVQGEERENLAYAIGQQLNTITEPRDLLQFAVETLASAFEYYHAHVYGYDDRASQLTVLAGLGKAGDTMVAEEHSIRLDAERSVVARAARSLSAVIIQNVADDDKHLPNPLIPDTKSEAAVPLFVGSQLLGVLDVQSDEANGFDESEVRLLSLVASQLSVALSNAQQLQDAETRLRNISVANQAGRIINETTDMRTMLQEILRVASNALGADNAVYTGWDNTAEEWYGLAGYNIDHDFVLTIRNPGEEIPHGMRAINTNEVVSVDNAYEYEDFPMEYVESIGIKSVAAMPVVGARDVHGVAFFNFNNDFHRFSQEEIALLDTVSRQVAIGIENKRFEERTRQNEERFRAMIESAPEAILVLDGQTGEFIQGSQPAVKLYEAESIDDVMGLTPLHFAPEVQVDGRTSAETVQNAIQAAFSGDSAVVYDWQVKTAKGNLKDTEVRVTLMPPDESGRPLIRASIFDVSDRRRAEREIEQRAEELAMVAEVATEATNVMDMNRLMTDAVELTKERFDLYHVHIYLIDGPVLRLAAGSGTAGQQMLGAGHQISLSHDSSLVASAARSGRTVISGDVTREPDFLPNPLLPRTRSEISVPLSYQRQVIGVLDMQSRTPDRFGRQEETIFQILAGQLAVAVENAGAFQREQERRRENELLAEIGQKLTQAEEEQDLLAAFDQFAQEYNTSLATLAYAEDNVSTLVGARAAGVEPMPLSIFPVLEFTVEEFPVMDLVISNLDEILVISDVENDPRVNKGTIYEFLKATNVGATISVPIVNSGRWRGTLSFNFTEPTEFGDDFIDTLYRIRPTLSAAVASRQAFLREQAVSQESQKQALELETVAQVTTATSTILETGALLKQVSELTKSAFELYHAHIYLYDDANKQLRLAAGAGNQGDIMLQNRHAIGLSNDTSVVAQAARERQGVIIADVSSSPTFLPNPLLPETRSEMALPMMVAGELLGVLDVQSNVAGRFTEDDLRIKSILAGQIAVAVKNAQAYEQQQVVNEKLNEVNQLKSQFLASMSHELRTPLNSIIGYSEVLLDGGDGELSEDAHEDVDIIYTSGRHLLAIINDILNLAKIEAGQMQLHKQPADLVNILRDVIKTNEVLIGDKPLELKLRTDVDELIMTVDELRMRQVVLNLFSNAVKFTEAGSITLDLTMQDDETVRVAVIDTGIGISEEGLEIVFDQFRQVDGTSTRKAGGTGLGLTITKYLVEMHGGEIYAESEVGEGTTFWFTLPLVEREVDPQEVISPV